MAGDQTIQTILLRVMRHENPIRENCPYAYKQSREHNPSNVDGPADNITA